MNDCIFCKITEKEIPSKIVYENDKVIAFEDINKCTPVHILVIPKQHIESILQINEDNKEIVVQIHAAINKIVKDLGVDKTGFRVITNCGKDAGQTIKHLHYHIIGGKNLGMKLICDKKH